MTYSGLQNLVPVLGFLLPATSRPINGLRSQAQLTSEGTTTPAETLHPEVRDPVPHT